MPELPRVTVAIPVKDRRERMLRCLDSVLALQYGDFEVVVLDNGSTDGTAEACRERGASAPVSVRVEVVEGLVGRVRNLGARIATGEVVAYTDSDCVVTPGWLAAGVAPFADPRVGVVTGCTLPAEPGPHGPWYATIDIREQTWRFETCNAFFRRDALLASGGFDERITMWEDAAGGWGVLLAGYEARFEPEAVVRHDVTYPGVRWHFARGRRYGEVAAIVARHPELRDVLLWRRLFLRPRNAWVAAAAAGLVLAPLSRWSLVLTLPYARAQFPRRPWPNVLLASAQTVLWDANILYGMLRNSARFRTLVI